MPSADADMLRTSLHPSTHYTTSWPTSPSQCSWPGAAPAGRSNTDDVPNECFGADGYHRELLSGSGSQPYRVLLSNNFHADDMRFRVDFGEAVLPGYSNTTLQSGEAVAVLLTTSRDALEYVLTNGTISNLTCEPVTYRKTTRHTHHIIIANRILSPNLTVTLTKALTTTPTASPSTSPTASPTSPTISPTGVDFVQVAVSSAADTCVSLGRIPITQIQCQQAHASKRFNQGSSNAVATHDADANYDFMPGMQPLRHVQSMLIISRF